MKIGIIGGGAVGLLFASYLSLKHDVSVYTRRDEQSNAIINKGITFINKDNVTNILINSQTGLEGIQKQDLIVVATKQYDISALLKVEEINKVKKILFIQNGMSHIEQLKNLSNKNIYLGIVEHGSLKYDDSMVEHTGIGVTKISAFRGDIENFKKEIGQISPHFEIQYYNEWYKMLISKLVVNAVINPLTAIFRVPNGELISNAYLLKITKELYLEIIKALNINEQTEFWAYIESVCQKTAQNRSSMLKDIEKGRKTEIDAILGYILNLADIDALPLTNFAYNSIKGLEHKQEGER